MLRERRWVVLAAGAGLTLLMCVAMILLVPAKFEKSARVLIMPPESKVDGRPTNPLMGLAGLEAVSDVLAVSMQAPDVVQAVDPQGRVEYTATRDFTLSAPVLTVDVSGSDRSEVNAALDRILAQLPKTLGELQSSAGVVQSSWVKSLVVTKDADASTVRKTQIRALLVAFAAGASLTYLALAVFSGLTTRRYPSRQQPGSSVSSLLVSQPDPVDRDRRPSRQGSGT